MPITQAWPRRAGLLPHLISLPLDRHRFPVLGVGWGQELLEAPLGRAYPEPPRCKQDVVALPPLAYSRGRPWL